MKEYEAIIIGAGGGTKLRPISDNHKIAIIEKEDPGGTCLNRGCIPSKMLIHPVDLVQEIAEAERFHVNTTQAHVDFEALVKETTDSVTKVSKGIADFYEKHEQIDYFHGEARFISDKVIEVNGEQLTANKIFIAVGARPAVPSIPGLEATPYMTSREALRAEKQPDSLIVIGGGYIGLELGHFYRGLGARVDFLVRSRLLRKVDQEIVEDFKSAFNHDDCIHEGTSIKSVEYEGRFKVLYEQEGVEHKIEAEALLIATGITPNTDRLGLENTSIKKSVQGYLEVDDHLQTSVEGVYALGDCVGNHFFRHSVNFEGEYLLRTLYEEPSKEPIRYPQMPWAVFSNPQIAGVGLTEEELIEDGVDYFKGVNPYKSSAMGGDVLKSEHGLVKLLFERSTHKLLGAHITGREASSMIHMCIAFINMGATLEDMLDKTIYIHPAFPEVIRNACRKAREV